ncbi:MAG: aspartate/glutamate racemase family protein [Pseudoflavonifractor sp.]|nr:aspartate/glutamate racemase family protein [Pseudoflavonifractor sp.]
MKTIGLIGGMSWESTVTYYQIINRVVQQRLGGLHSAQVLLDSVDFAEIEACQSNGDWDKSARLLANAALRLERAGADLVLICTNTMHKVAPQVQAALHVPLLHIADATAEALRSAGVDTVALLGTKYTMCQNFYKEKLISADIRVLIPDEPDVELVNRVIFDELCLGVLKENSRQEFLRIIDTLARKGARGVILGCTEIGLLISQSDTALPVFDTTLIHATRAAELALG